MISCIILQILYDIMEEQETGKHDIVHDIMGFVLISYMMSYMIIMMILSKCL
jgi:hypothetical protein